MQNKIIGALAAFVGVFAFACIAFANPFEFNTSNVTATTTVSYMTPGAATTTYYYDSLAYGSDDAAAFVQFTATSTATILKWGYEFSMGDGTTDCVATPTKCDWYKDNISLPVLATSTGVYTMNSPIEYSWTFASTTQGYVGVPGNNNRALKMIYVPTPARFTRMIFTVTGGNGGVWAAFVNKKQSSL